mgnify:FL=1
MLLAKSDIVIEDSNLAEDIAVSAKNLTVSYRSYSQRPSTIKEAFIRFIKKGDLKFYTTFKALSNVSFEIRRGDTVALVGSNGCGKSTLLRVISGVLKPTTGTININGSIASLISLGAGFDPELSAVENIYLFGSLYKKTKKEIDKHVDSIIEFAELSEFKDTPIKYYSSGMYARLGFSAAIDLDPDILIIDEILSVGYIRFQAKCNELLLSLKARGKTIIIVSHDLDTVVKIAPKGILLRHGEVIYAGESSKAVEIYRSEDYIQPKGNAEVVE